MELVHLLDEEGTRVRSHNAAASALQALNILPHLGWENEHLFLVVVSERFSEAHAGLPLERVFVDVLKRVRCLFERTFYHASFPPERGIHPSSLVLVEAVIGPLFDSLL